MQRIIIGLIVLFFMAACAQKPPKMDDTQFGAEEISPQIDVSVKNPVPPLAQDDPVEEKKQAVNQAHQPESIAPEPAAIDLKPETPEPPGILWEHLISLYKIPQVSNPKVTAELRWYLRHPNYLERVQQRAEPFLFEIVNQIENYGLPGEIALLPIVESAFRPYAYSSGRAAGIWQFIPSTGRHYGLAQNWWYDGRRDIYSSTQAAMRYLKKLHAEFNGDWLLALAAYNSGEGTVAKAIRRNRRSHKPTDFWHLRLPKETRQYVPRLLAIAKVIQDADKYGIKLRPIPKKPVFEAVDIGTQLDLAVAAEMSGMPLHEIYALNPGFNRWATAPDGPHLLLVPIDKSEAFKSNLAKLKVQDRIKWSRHKIRKDETLGHIAQKYQTTASVLRQVNRIRGSIIHQGKNLMIPHAKLDPSFYQQKRYGNRSAQFRPSNGKKRVHVVRRGESFWTISRKYAVNMKQLARWNNLSTRKILRPGQRLKVWTQPQRPTKTSRINDPMNPFQSANYTVKKGDSLYLISRRFNVKIADLRKWNATRIGRYLKPGQKLKVRDDNDPAT